MKKGMVTTMLVHKELAKDLRWINSLARVVQVMKTNERETKKGIFLDRRA